MIVIYLFIKYFGKYFIIFCDENKNVGRLNTFNYLYNVI